MQFPGHNEPINPQRERQSLKIILNCIFVVSILISIIISIPQDAKCDPPVQPYAKTFKKAAVVANGKECADIGRNIFKKGGSVADAAIATLLCEGVACFQSMGIGGGFLLVIYSKATKTVNTLNAREAAPMASYEDMFDGNSSLSTRGGLAVAVPGELRGYGALYRQYGGKVKWKDLFEPTIHMCRSGILITDYTARVLKSREADILVVPSLRCVFINPATNKTWVAGDRMKRPVLATTLEIIAKQGVDALYNGSLTDQFVEDIRAFNGVISRADLENYQVKWEEPILVDLHSGMKLYTAPLPGSGPVLKVMLNTFQNFLPDSLDQDLTWHRIIETFKYAYGVRTEFGDPTHLDSMNTLVQNVTSPEFAAFIRKQIEDNLTYSNPKHYGAKYFQRDDHGTAHLSFVAPNGDAISVTSTVNLVLGAFIRSPSTGIILNNEMDDFSDPYMSNAFGLPPSPANFIQPGKRPLSSMCPAIVLDKFGNVRLVIGGAGGTKITTSVALVILRHLYFNQGIVDAMVAPRLHHQLSPMKLTLECGFSDDLINHLQEKGHRIQIRNPGDGFAAITAIAKESNWVPFSDVRRNGSVAGLN